MKRKESPGVVLGDGVRVGANHWNPTDSDHLGSHVPKLGVSGDWPSRWRAGRQVRIQRTDQDGLSTLLLARASLIP